MSAPAASVEERLLAVLERLERKVDAALRPPPRLLSKRAAAKLLGVDRGTTLEAWVRDGVLRVVGGKIPMPDVERLLSEGLPAPKARHRPVRQDRSAESEAEAIRKLTV